MCNVYPKYRGGAAQREQWADILKGIGVLLVILGHTSRVPTGIVLWIYSFHMPLFFWVSGYFFKPNQDTRMYILKKCRSLIAPYILYSAIFLLSNAILVREDSEVLLGEIRDGLVGQGTDGILWFFVALFWTEVVFHLTEKYFHRFTPLIILVYVFSANYFSTITGYESGMFKLPSAFFAVGFYYIGYVFRKNDLISKIHIRYMIIAVFLNLLCTKLLHPSLSLNIARSDNVIMGYIVAMLGIIGFVGVSKILDASPLSPIQYVLSYIGRESLYFYPITGYAPVAIVKILNNLGFAHNIVVVLISKAVGFITAWLMSYMHNCKKT